MKKSKIFLSIVVVAFLFAIILVGCQKEQHTPVSETWDKQPALPASTFSYSAKHGINDHLATLGRVLFYDQNLSVNNAVSCGSCHKQERAFADDVRFSKGYNGMPLKRNSPSIQGVRSSLSTFFDPMFGPTIAETRLFWDGRQNSITDMMLNPVTNHDEMNMPGFDALVTKLSKVSYYPPLFERAFGTPAITKERIAQAMEAFVACLNTDNPMEGNDMNNFEPRVTFPGQPGFLMPTGTLTPLQEQGRTLFHTKYNCATCHDPSHGGGYNGGGFGVPVMFNIGLDEVPADKGLGGFTGRTGDMGLFKVPTLQNISLTAPYMHDGRFNNLGEVLDHYSHEVKANPNLSPVLKDINGAPKPMNIKPAEKMALIAFLNTLKDEDFLTSPMYSDPFK